MLLKNVQKHSVISLGFVRRLNLYDSSVLCIVFRKGHLAAFEDSSYSFLKCGNHPLFLVFNFQICGKLNDSLLDFYCFF